jgi:hypothetical protein
MHRK